MESGRWVKAIRAQAVLLSVLLASVAGCALPFEFTKQGWSGNAGAVDPSTPDLTAIPKITYTQSAGSGGTVTDGGSVTTVSDTAVNLVTDTPGAVIFFTLDGSKPDPRASQTGTYTPGTPISLSISSPTPANSSKVFAIRAIAIGPNMKPSVGMSASVNLQYPQVAQPVFSVAGGSYATNQSVTLSTATAGATVYYTMVNGAGPAPVPVPGHAGTTAYAGPISLTGPTGSWTISAIATADQMIDSTLASASYSVTWVGLQTPTFNPPGGTYHADQNVVIDSDPGATIWYTTDGTAPGQGTGTSQQIASGSSILMTGKDSSGTVMLRAVATESQAVDSSGASASYLFQAATPNASPGVGTYFGSVVIFSVSASPSVYAIYYTTDGSTPSNGSTLYMGAPISSSSTFTLGLVAYKTNYAPSIVSRIHYTVVPPDFSSITAAIIASQDSVMTGGAIDDSDGNVMPIGDLILYRTNAGNYGTMVITTENSDGNHGILFNYRTYAVDGSVLASGTNVQCRGTFLFDLDGPGETPSGPLTGQEDFWVENQTSTARSFSPVGGARFVVVGVDPTP
jgi:hypothetical protein